MEKALLLVALMLIAAPLKAMTDTAKSDTPPCIQGKTSDKVRIQPASPASAPFQRPYRYGADHGTNTLI